jgi:hypothetical protein
MRREYVPPSLANGLEFVFESFAMALEGCTPEEIRSFLRGLSERTRDQLACYCLGNERLKEVGREIAAACFGTDSLLEPADKMKASVANIIPTAEQPELGAIHASPGLSWRAAGA